jgi:NADH-quinone oxidoreductase subunit H
MCLWFIIPILFYVETFEFPLSVLLVMAVSGMSVLSNIFAGWSSNSKYSLMGGVRAASQLISYEMCLLLVMVSVCMLAGSVSLVDIINGQEYVWYFFPLLPMFVIFFIIGLAETNRSPFDLAEAESELVAGYNVEYSSIAFVFFFLAEYGNLVIMSMLMTCLFLGGGSCLPFLFLPQNSICFAIKCTILVYFFLMARAVLPRFRYDDLMSMGWTKLFPICFFNFIYVVVLKVCIFNLV